MGFVFYTSSVTCLKLYAWIHVKIGQENVTKQKRIVIEQLGGHWENNRGRKGTRGSIFAWLRHPENWTRRKAKTVLATYRNFRLRHPENWKRRKSETATPGQPQVSYSSSGSLGAHRGAWRHVEKLSQWPLLSPEEKRSEHTDRNVHQLKPTVLFRTTPTHLEVILRPLHGVTAKHYYIATILFAI